MTSRTSVGRTIRWALLASVLAAASVSGAAQAGEPPAAGVGATVQRDVSAEVGRLFDAAQAAFAKKDYPAAYEAYHAAWALQRSYDIAGNLGAVEIKLGKLRDAAEHLSFAVKSFPPTGQSKQRQALMSKLEGVLPKVGRVRVRVSVDGASVLLKGVAIGMSPIAEEVFVEPGVSTFEAKREGYENARAAVEVAAGATQEATLTLRPVAHEAPGTKERSGAAGPAGMVSPNGPDVSQGPVRPGETTEPAQRSLVPAFVIGGVGGVALIGGLVLIGVAESKRSSAEALSEETGHACPVDAPSPQGKCAELADAASSTDTFGNVGIGGLVIAGAAAAGVAAYLLWPAPADKPARSAVRAVPVAGLGGGGVVVTGSF